MLDIMPTVNMLARADHFAVGRTHKIDTVIIHATGGTNSLNWLRYLSDPPVSCHILISRSGQRYRIVDDWNTAWHAGYSTISLAKHATVNVNARSLGVELENLNDGTQTYPEIQLDALATQLWEWDQAHSHLLWYFHRDVDSRKRDPARLNMAQIRRSYARIGSRLHGTRA